MKLTITDYFRIVAFLFFAFLNIGVQAQTSEVKGKVLDEKAAPLPGASVLVKGTTIGAQTNFDGEFTLEAVPSGSTLIISYVGYKSIEVRAESGKSYQLEVDSASLKEVIVTAENRNTSAQKVPITMDIVGGIELTTQGITDVSQLQNLAPSLSIQQSSNFSLIFIRGVGSQAAGQLQDQAATLNVDGEYLNRPIALNATLFDLERIEVLKGPQGTLYGKNSTAGAINIIAAKPRLNDLSGNVQLNYGSYNTLKVNTAINAPLGNKAAVRAAFLTDSHDGYRQSNGDPNNGGYRGDFDNGNVWGARLGLLTKPIDKLSIYLVGEKSKMDQQATAQFGIPSDDPRLAPFSGTRPKDFKVDLPEDFDIGTDGSNIVDQAAIRTNISYDFTDALKFTYRGGYRNIVTETYQPLNGFVPETFSFERNRDFDTWSHEFRLNGQSKKLIWQGGLFLGSEKGHSTGGLLFAFARRFFDGETPYGNYSDIMTETSTTGVFGQATYNFDEKWAITGGLRYTKDKKEQDGIRLTGGPFGPPPSEGGPTPYFYPNGPVAGDPTTGPNTGNGSGEWSQVTWLGNLEYKPNDNTMHFAKISTGYKAGGFTPSGSYDPEFITSLEIGSKNRLSDRFKLNISAFYYIYNDQQIAVFIDTETGFDTKNAGQSSYFGLELEGDYLITPKDQLSFNINYLNAELKDFTTELNIVDGDSEVADLSGNTPEQSPEWIISAGYNHLFNIGSGKLNAGVNSMFKSAYFIQPINNAMDEQPAYTKTDLYATYTSGNGKWDLGVYVNNLEDNRILVNASFLGNPVNIYNWSFGAPRIIGAKAAFRF